MQELWLYCSRYIFLSAFLISKWPLYIICNFYNILAEHDLILFAELAFTMKVDNKTDVYSFGVVTLEVIMGRHPGELISSLLSSASSSSTSPPTADHFLLNDVIDQRPSPPVNQVAKEVEVAVKLAFACLRVNPQSRPTMQQVARALSTQWPPLSKPFSMITLLELQDHGHGGETS